MQIFLNLKNIAPFIAAAFLQVACLLPVISFSQGAWTTNPFAPKAFVENKGQFDGSIVADKVLYGINSGSENVFFTSKGVNFIYRESEDHSAESSAANSLLQSKEGDKKETKPIKFSLISMQWLNANQEVQVYAEQPVPDFYSYFDATSKDSVLRCTAYKKIIYKNLYPGVDVEYTFHREQGIKYALILHPGADHSSIKMVYSGSKNLHLDEKGNLRIKCPGGEIIDHAPETFYQADHTALAIDQETVKSSYVLDANIVMFRLGQYDRSRTVIIDPWTITPGFGGNGAYDLVRNPANGDIFIYGGAPPYQCKKLDASGNVLWTYTANLLNFQYTFYGDLVIDPAGDVYLSATSNILQQFIIKINGNTTALIWSSGSAWEPWRMQYDALNNRIVVGGLLNQTPGSNIGALNPATGALTSQAIITAPGNAAEVRSFVISANGTIYALHVGYNVLTNNTLTANTPAFANIYTVPNNYFMGESGPFYASNQTPFGQGANCHGFNGIVIDANYIYTYDGSGLYKKNIANGSIVGNVTVPGGIVEENGGIVVDACGNIYVGTQNSIRQYDSMLVFVSSSPVAGEVYDLVLGAANEILACGNGFVTSVYFSCSSILSISTTSTLPCSMQCTGTASVSPTGGTQPYSYLWSTSPAQSIQAVTGLCAGTYSVLVTDAANDTTTATIIITQPPALLVSSTFTDATCGNNNGSAIATASGGTGAYTYSWSPGAQTTATVSGLGPGTYTAIVVDANGCAETNTVAITQSPAINSTISSIGATCGNNNGTATITSSGGTGALTYSWNPGGQITTTATGLGGGTYAVTTTDSIGCSKTETVSVTQSPGPILATSASAYTITIGASTTLSVSGGGAYQWSPSVSLNCDTCPNPVATPTESTLYCVITSDANGCTDSTCITINVDIPCKALYIPNAFSPNNDLENDEECVFGDCIEEFHLVIFNRWGEKVFESIDHKSCWDGTYRGESLSSAVFHYYLKATLKNGENVSRKGNISLVR